MSSAIAGSSYGTLDRMLASVGSLRDQFATLQQQTTTGKVAQTYEGLAAQSSQVLDLTAASTRNAAYAQSITQAQGKASVMQDALSQISIVVSSMAANVLNLSGSVTGATVDTVAQQARLALAQVASLMNTTYAGDYVFGGADTSNPPVRSPDSVTGSGAGPNMFTQIGAAVSAFATVPTTPPVVGAITVGAVVIAAPLAANTTIFSSYLTMVGVSAAPATFQIADAQRASLDLPANVGAMGDILRSLAVMANGTGPMAANPDFATLMRDTAATLTSAGATVARESGQLGVTQNAMAVAASSHASMQTILTKQLSSLTDVDMAGAISNLQAVSSQLQASYNVLSMMHGLNLSSFL
jgi:flagellar hook-associated protein 3 FlgL